MLVNASKCLEIIYKTDRNDSTKPRNDSSFFKMIVLSKNDSKFSASKIFYLINFNNDSAPVKMIVKKLSRLSLQSPLSLPKIKKFLEKTG